MGKKIAIIFGGSSSEKEVSLASGRNVFYCIDKNKYNPSAIFIDSEKKFYNIPMKLIMQNKCIDIESGIKREKIEKIKIEYLKKFDLVFIALHGKYGEDGCIQGLLKIMDIPFASTNLCSSALGMNKKVQKDILKYHKINTPKYITFKKSEFKKKPQEIFEKLKKILGKKIVLKPIREGSSFGVGICETLDGFVSSSKKAFEFDKEIIAEEFLDGREFSCMIIGNSDIKVLQVTELIHENEIFTYEEKYLPGASEKKTPFPTEDFILEKIKEECKKTYNALGFSVYARIDGFLTNDKKIFINDPNTTVGLAPSSFAFHQAADAGFSPQDFITRLIEISLV